MKKDWHIGNSSISWFVLLAGHACTGNWDRGMKFLVIELVGSCISLYYLKKEVFEEKSRLELDDEVIGVIKLVIVGIIIWEYF